MCFLTDKLQSRPHTVSQHWSAALAAEWASQALLERQLRLPVSVQDSDDPVTEAKGQISFIQAFCLPLLEITAVAIPGMKLSSNFASLNHFPVLTKYFLTRPFRYEMLCGAMCAELSTMGQTLGRVDNTAGAELSARSVSSSIAATTSRLPLCLPAFATCELPDGCVL